MKRRSFLKILGITPCVVSPSLVNANTEGTIKNNDGSLYDGPFLLITNISAEDSFATMGPAGLNKGRFCHVGAFGSGNNKLVVDGEYILHPGELMSFESDGTQWRKI